VTLFVMVKSLATRAERAESIVAHVQATAPQFYLDARALLRDGEFQQALGKIDAAIALDPGHAIYQLIKGHACESLLLLDPAITAYEKVLTLTPTNTLALANLELCRRARASRGGPAAPENLYEFHRLMLKQGRLAEALHMAQRLPTDRALLQRTWVAILQAAGLRPELDLNDDGTFDLSLNDHSHVDLGLLRGLPLRKLSVSRSQISDLSPLRGTGVRQLDLSGNPVRDLSALGGIPLEVLNLANTEVTNLFPLAGMPLRELNLDDTPVNDFTPLRGLSLETLRANGTTAWNLQPLSESPLKVLNLARTHVSDLSPLRHLPLTALNLEATAVANLEPLTGAPLAVLNLSGTPVRDLSPLRGMPVRELLLGACPQLNDVQMLRTCLSLERLVLPKQCTHLQMLRQLPRLRFLAYESDNAEADRKQTAQFFWATYRGL
jgi:tetratricopeptide (TPR) repeat protein